MERSRMEGKILQNFEAQVKACRNLGSPFTAMLCEVLPKILDRSTRLGAAVIDWPGNPGADALSLRVTGGLHALVRSGKSPGLAAVYPPYTVDNDELALTVEDAIAVHDEFLFGYLDSPPQTNEVARSAVIVGGCLMVAKATGLPLSVFEIGSSAGLNLGFDRYRYDFGGETWGDPASPVAIRCEWSGDGPDLAAPLSVASRAGCDVRPLDPFSAADRERLLSYIWADQSERLARTAAALKVAAAAPWRVDRADAGAWVSGRLPETVPGRARVLMHSVVWQYLPEATKASVSATLDEAARHATREAPLAWFRMEYDGTLDCAGVRLTLWPGGEEHRLADADYHGRWVRWAGLEPTLG